MSKIPNQRDNLCHLVRNHMLAVRLEHRNILKSLMKINELHKQFEQALSESGGQYERLPPRTAPIPEDVL